ncbi:MAG: error-prone DNA polymerase [Limnobacter sp. CACIAM 66H1]|uniref:error-prone DNA polymerase n=1 Tax=Limnobacter sp. CACIAM 66H1 TaxID=1813033 RepID=UPI0007A83DE9|nr:error-prone DNA polymerase [Limnobacter sp. CACIAM 66H1]KYP10830.1 MAG: error-prone DNA polymerase [Limnobacter sp. CACIAM 66H1]
MDSPLQTLPPFAEALALSNFSFLKGASHAEELVQQAKLLGYRAIGIADECSLAGIVRAHQAAKECGIQLLVGAQFVFAHSSLFAGQRIALIVKNKTGYTHLCRLITQARNRAAKGDYLFTRDDLADIPPGLQLLLIPDERNKENFPALLSWCAKRFTGRMHLVCNLQGCGFDKAWLLYLQALAHLHQIELLASNLPVMHSSERKNLHDVLTAIRLNCNLNEAKPFLETNAQRCLQPLQVLAQTYPHSLLMQTTTLAAQCVFSLDELRYQYPREISPEGIEPTQYLRQLVEKGAAQRYSDQVPAKVRKQIEHELLLIEELKFEAYFLTVYDIVRFARSRNILCQGRGSAANSVVCYCLHITEVNPDKMAVLFERFISRERNEPPDIDVDFEHTRREEVIQYIYKKYGRDRAALAASVVVYRPRSALRDVGKALGLDTGLVERLAKSQDGGYSRSMSVDHMVQAGIDVRQSTVQRCVHLADELLGFPRHLSQHTGGFVIARDSLTELVPVENASMPDRSVIQWDKDDLDAMGLMKVDVLALGMLSAIRMTLDELNRKSNAPRTLQDIPPEDSATYDMMCKADTVGVFQIESRAQMGMLPRLQPRDYYDLVIQVAIVRPGPIQGGMVHPFLKRRQGLEAVNYPSEALKEALGRTKGVPIFQEQVMQIAILAAGFTPGEADALRRGMAAWKRKGGLHHFYERVVSGMLKRGYTREFAESIFKQMEGFGEYGFPESHAASFAMLVYASAWLKCHHPDAFLCGLLNAQPMGFYAPSQLIQDAQRHGVTVKPVDVQCSAFETRLENNQDLLQHEPARGNRTLHPVRLGLNRVNGLKHNSALRIVQTREQGLFESVEDLTKRAQLDRSDLLALADANALAQLAGHRRQAVWQTAATETGGIRNTARHTDLLANTRTRETPLELPKATELEDMLADYRATGASLVHHPISFLREQLTPYKIRQVKELQTYPNGRLARACGIVTHRQRPATAHGTVFLNLEDETGNVNVIVWNRLAEEQRQVLRNAQIMGVFGIWQREGEVCNLVARRLVDYTHLLLQLQTPSRDFK